MQSILELARLPTPSYQDMRSLLKQLKASGKNLPSLVAGVCCTLLGNHKATLGEDYYLVLEELFYASLETESYGLSEKALGALYRRFGRTDRILKMQADFCEGRGYDEKALEIHTELLKENLLDTNTMKKKIGLVRTQGHLGKSVSLLNGYLSKQPTDEEAWLQLADCYQEAGANSKAQHCYSQLLMLDPNNLNYVLLLAETSHTAGGQANLQTAKTYYCYLLLQDNTHLRALFALLALLPKLKEDSSAMGAYLKKHLKTLYGRKNAGALVNHL